MRIASVASAFPEYYYKQEILTEALKNDWRHRLSNPDILDRLDESMQVEGRYLVEPIDFYEGLTTWGQANNAWIAHALELGEESLCKALHKAGIGPKDLGAIFVTSVTGIAAPSLDARLVNRMGLSPNIKRIPIFGLGCVAGAAGISRAADYVKAYPDQAAALLSVELCSLTLQRDDLSMAHLISALLFGDGAAATVITGSNRKADGPEILATKSSFYLHSEKVMGWDISEKGFRIVLSPEVPEMVTKHLGKDVDAFLAENGAKRSDIKSWIMHTGGPKVSGSDCDRAGNHGGRFVGIVVLLAARGKYFFHVRAARSGRRVHQPSSGAGLAEHSGRDGSGLLRGVSFVTLVGSGGQWPQARKS